ncbi:ABC transporter permease [Clostridia bacterium]|nr:ABC transporter permease [Clostridia bacterium]
MTANFSNYFRFLIKRERITSLFWILGIVLFSGGIAAAYPVLFPDQEAISGMLATLGTPPMVAMMGPLYGLAHINFAILFAQQCLMWVALAAAIMNIFLVVRVSRADEELGRNEIIASLPVGRLTGGVAAIVLAFALNVLIAVLSAFLILLTGIEGLSVQGAFVFGLSIGMQGFVFAGITLFFAQIFSTASAAIGTPFAVLGLSYILRGAGDMMDASNAVKVSATGFIMADYKMTDPLSFLSPLGLGLKVEAFYKNFWWPVLILFLEALVFAGIALVLNARRDIGAGLVPAKAGRTHGGIFLRNPLGFAFRLLRGSFIGWGIGLLLLGMSYGSVLSNVSTFVQGNEMIQKMLEASGSSSSMENAFLVMISVMMAMITAIPLIMSVNRFRTEESHGRLEAVFSLATSRVGLLGSFAFIALLQALVLPLFYGLGLYSVATKSVSLKTCIETAIVYAPANLFFVGLAVLLVGCLPKLTKLIWLPLGYSFFVIYFGRLIPNMPKFMDKLSPFGYVPQIPVEPFHAMPLLVLSGLGLLLVVAGLIGVKKRDIG